MKKNQPLQKETVFQREVVILSDLRITFNKYSDSTSNCMCMCMCM
ncbi:hypothetical protein SAMN02910357_00684 [Succinivibrio dextrinosolvens]|nr:hypothetical protein [Succinivibrio dextrinosolvens]SFS42965.1 hypothetical protein SAMN02910357_00684 [Succinivibrio dextrinosolvens]